MTIQPVEPRWTGEEALAYVCARAAISDMLTMERSFLADEKANNQPNNELINQLEKRIIELEIERYNLCVKDADEIAKIRKEYGAIIRDWYAKT